MKTAIKLLLLYFAYQLLFGAAMMGLSQLWPVGPTTQLALSLLLSGAAMTVHLVAGRYVDLRQSFRPVGLNSMLCCIVCTLSTMIGCNALSELITLPNWLASDFTDLSHNLLGVAGITLVAPWVEELLFRGAILQRLNRGRRSPWRGIVLSALLFGLIHVNPAQVFFAIPMGIALGWITVQTRSLWPAIIGHVVNNSLSVVEMVTNESRGTAPDYTTMPAPELALAAIIALACAFVVGRKLRHHMEMGE
ncbi:MAG: CPBP family intramembrane metalloprotease [Bacteroidaceae bacterium]|nr:CPBP family intramembrane metalloprotease [Bacteroidaceae bacterium]